MADVNRATADPAGGKILRDPAGRPTGVLIDRAQALVRAKVPAASLAEVERRLERAAGECARLGMTSVADAGIGATELAAYRELIAQHRLPVRIYAMLSVSMNETALWRSYQAKGPQVSDFLTVRSLKLYADGALGSRGAALLDPYTDDPHNTGILISSEDFIRTTAQEAAKAGFQVNTHAIGDRAVHIVLNAYAAALNGPNDRRFRIEHAQIVAPGDFARFKRYAVIASMQPTHATSDMPWAEQRLGPRRILGAYAWQTMWKAGVPVASGSDFPVENPNPLWGFYSAVTRQDHEGNPPAGWYPAQRMSRDEALRSWTYEGAYAAFQENDKGTLEAGKLADFVMLSDDIMQSPARQIWEARVRLTVLGGEIVFHQP
jgi:predicted amidohydrolase YtcJ